MAKSRLAQLALLVFALSLVIRLPFVFHPAVLHFGEAEYLDLSRNFVLAGRGLSCLRGWNWSETSQPLVLPLAVAGTLKWAANFHPEPEKMLTDARSWKIARITNAVVGNLAVVVWFLVAISLTNSLSWSTLFALLLATNSALVQNSAMNMPEQWLLLLSGLAFWSWMQTSNRFLPVFILAALAFAFWIAMPFGSNEFFAWILSLSGALYFALYLLMPFWLLFGLASWLSGDRHSTRLFVWLISASMLVMFGFWFGFWFWENAYLEFEVVVAILAYMALPWLIALPFALFLILSKRWISWESDGAVWVGIGGAIAAVAVHARPEGALLALAIPFVLRKPYQRAVALSAWMLGLTWSFLPFLYAHRSLPMAEWLLVFRVLDFQQDSWRLYGQALPGTFELIANHLGEIVGRILVKSWKLLLYLGQGLGLLWVIVPLSLFRKEKLDLPSQLKAMPLMGLLFFAVHCIVWSTRPEPRLVVMPLAFFSLWFVCLWHGWLRNKQPAFKPVAFFAVILSIVLFANWWELVRTWRAEPEWHPEAMELASAMAKAMVEPDPMEAQKHGCGVVSNMPWLIYLHAYCLLKLMPSIETHEEFSAFVRQYYPQAFVFLLRGRTPQQAIEDEPRAKALLRWHDGRLSLKEGWEAGLELVDWKLFRNRHTVNIVALLVLRKEPSKFATSRGL
jgi:hypothetical protein